MKRITWRVAALVLGVGAATGAMAQAELDSLAGHWSSDLQMSARYGDGRVKSYFWVGPVAGSISSTGRATLKAQNGCVLQTLLVATSNAGRTYKGVGNVLGCEYVDMNRQYEVEARAQGTQLVITGTARAKTGNGRATGVYSMRATLAKMQR